MNQKQESAGLGTCGSTSAGSHDHCFCAHLALLPGLKESVDDFAHAETDGTENNGQESQLNEQNAELDISSHGCLYKGKSNLLCIDIWLKILAAERVVLYAKLSARSDVTAKRQRWSLSAGIDAATVSTQVPDVLATKLVKSCYIYCGRQLYPSEQFLLIHRTVSFKQ